MERYDEKKYAGVELHEIKPRGAGKPRVRYYRLPNGDKLAVFEDGSKVVITRFEESGESLIEEIITGVFWVIMIALFVWALFFN